MTEKSTLMQIPNYLKPHAVFHLTERDKGRAINGLSKIPHYETFQQSLRLLNSEGRKQVKFIKF